MNCSTLSKISQLVTITAANQAREALVDDLSRRFPGNRNAEYVQGVLREMQAAAALEYENILSDLNIE